MEYITIPGPTATAMLRQLDYDHKHADRRTCQVKGCPQQGMVSLRNGALLCAWHDIAWGAFLTEHQNTTGKCLRLGKFGNWHIRFKEFLAWAEKNPKDRTALPGRIVPNTGEDYQRWTALR